MNKPTRLQMIKAIESAAADLEDGIRVKAVEPSAAAEVEALRAAAELIRSTPAPLEEQPLPLLEVQADPARPGSAPCHQWRYICTEGTTWDETGLSVDTGSTIATMTDCLHQKRLAYAMAAAPELLEAAKLAFATIPSCEEWQEVKRLLEQAIEKASGLGT